MKRLFLLLVIITTFSCTKEKDQHSLIGTWNLTQISAGSPSPIFLNGNELSVEFKSDGCFDILGPKPNYSFLQDFNQYEVLTNDRIRFFNVTTQEQLYAVFDLGEALAFSYEVNYPYQEKFTRR